MNFDEHGRMGRWPDLLAGIIASAMDGIIAIDEAQTIVLFNSAAERMFVCPAREAIGNSIERFIPQRFRAEHSAHIRGFAESGVTRRSLDGLGTLWALRATGEEFPIEASIAKIESGGNKFFAVVVRDITERRLDVSERMLAEKTLRESEERFRLATQAGKMYAYEWDVATDRIFRSGDIRNVLGSSGEASLMRQQLLAKVHPDDQALFNASVTERTPENPDVQISYRTLSSDGSVIWLEKTAHAFFDEQGRMLRMIGMVADITERKLAEDKLREYERAVEGSEDMIVVVDREYRYLVANRKFLKMRKLTREQVVGRFADEVLNEGFFESVARSKLDECFEGNVVRYETKYTYPDLGDRDVSVSYFPVEGVSGIDRIACIIQDISERKRAEEAVRESEERLRLATLAGKMYAYEWDVVSDVLLRSAEYVKILGSTEPERFTRPDFMNKIHPDDRAKFNDTIAGLTPENPTGDVTYRVLLPGRAPLWLKNSGRAFFDEKGRMLRVIGMVADVTDYKLAEEALFDVNRRLIQAQEQERSRIGRELHDDVTQRLALLAAKLDQLSKSPDEVQTRAQELYKETVEISNDVQALSHDLHSSKLEYLGVISGMKIWCKEFATRQNADIEFTSEMANRLPLEIGLCLFRVIQESLRNAISHSGVKHIEVRLSEHLNQARLTVSDSGKGFNVEAAMKGKGLGLTSMRERVRLVNGTIAIESKPMNGTKILVCVPLLPEFKSQLASV
jgi:PAS domain S-box-containing protein